MSTDWTAFAFKRALATQVAARSGIADLTNPKVKVLTYLPPPHELVEAIVLGFAMEDTKEMVALGGKTHDEVVDVRSQIRTSRPGGGESVAQTAEDRGELLLSEVDEELRSNPITVVGAQIINPSIASREHGLYSIRTQDETEHKVCVIEFVIRYRAKTSA